MGGALAAAGVPWVAPDLPTDRPGDDRLLLWYDAPATDWESQALPVGNGALGAMVFGGTTGERIQFNEKTLWTGGPGETPDYHHGNWVPPRPGALAEARRLILEEGPQPPERIAALLGQPKLAYGSYQPFGDLHLDLPAATGVTGYRRELDLGTALSRVTYVSGAVRHHREVFASRPDHVLVVRLGADRPGAVDVTVRLTTPHPDTTLTIAEHTATVSGHLSNNGMRLEARMAVLAEGGQRTDSADGIRVTGADAVTILLAAGTDYEHTYPDYRGPDPHRRVTATLAAAVATPYARLLRRHLADHRALFDRVRLRLGPTAPEVPTDRLLAAYTGGPEPENRALEQLFFAYGRYLLIASSRPEPGPADLPANLQGVWNKDTAAAWSGDYHANMNLQMNYWPAEVTNLAETAPPLAEFVHRMRPARRQSARLV